MTGTISDYLANAQWAHAVAKAAFTMPTHVYVALSTTTPNTDGSNVTEPVGNGYTRVTTAAADWNAPTARGISNANALTFPTAMVIGEQ